MTKSTRESVEMSEYSLLSKNSTAISLLIPALLTERGIFSNQIYRADINHRNIDYFVLNNVHNKGRAIKDSFCNPTAEEQFDMSAPIILPHAIVPTSAETPLRMMMKAQKLSKLPNHNTSLKGFIDGKMIAKIDKEQFKRLLAIFGISFVNADRSACEEEPSTQDLVKFLSQVKVPPLYDNGFKRFLEEYKFEKLFKYDSTVDEVININRFGWFLRSLTNIRFSPCEGQHRWWCFSSMIQGLPHAKSELPLERVPLNAFTEEFLPLKNWQIHLQRVIVTLDLKEYSVQGLTQCFKLSDDSRKAQKSSVDFSLFSFLCQFCNKIGSNWEDLDCEDVVFGNYWHAKVNVQDNQLVKNFKQVWKALKSDINDDSGNNMSELFNTKSEWMKIQDVGDKAASKPEFRFSQTTTGWTKNMFLIFYLLKAFCNKRDSMFILPAIDTKDAWEDQRTPNQKAWTYLFRKVDFLQRVKDCVDNISYYLELRLWVEQELIKIFRANYLEFRPYLKEGVEVPLKLFEIDGKNSFSIPDYAERFKRHNLFPANTTSDVLRKVLESLTCLIYQDIFRAIEKHGFDPKIFSDEDVQGLLNLDAHQVFDPSKDGVISDNVRKNYCLKMYLNHSDAEDNSMMTPFAFTSIDTTVVGAKSAPNFTKSTREMAKNAKPTTLEGRTFSIDILLQLYPYYVKMNHEPFLRKLLFLAPHLGFYCATSKKQIKMENGINLRSSGFDPKVLREIKKVDPTVNDSPPFDMFKDDHLLFSDFIRDIKDGTFNTDFCQPFMKHVAFELGATSEEPSHNLESQFDGWQERSMAAVKASDVLDEMGGMKAIDQQRTPKSSSKTASSSSTTSKKDPPNSATSSAPSATAQKASTVTADAGKKTKKAAKAALTVRITQAMKHETTTAREIVECLGRLAYNYQEIGVNRLFSVTFNKDFLQKRNMNDKNEMILWNQALHALGEEPHFPKVGLGENGDLPVFSWNSNALVLKKPPASPRRRSPPRQATNKNLTDELDKEEKVKCSYLDCTKYTVSKSPVQSCKKCERPVHFECGALVDAKLWCRPCLHEPKSFKRLHVCPSCNEQYFHKQKGRPSLDGTFQICEECYETTLDMDESSSSSENDDDDDEDEQAKAVKGNSVVENVEYPCCAEQLCTNPEERVIGTAHNLCSSCNKHGHLECFLADGQCCLLCNSTKETQEQDPAGGDDDDSKKSSDENSKDEDEGNSQKDTTEDGEVDEDLVEETEGDGVQTEEPQGRRKSKRKLSFKDPVVNVESKKRNKK